MKYLQRIIPLAAVVLSGTLCPPPASTAFSDNQSAIAVIGQPDMSGNGPNRGPFDPIIAPDRDTLYWPGGLKVVDGKLLVADYHNHRVLIFDPVPTWNDATAQVVIGQSDMISNGPNQDPLGQDPEVPYANTLYRPDDIVFGEGKFIVSDSRNNRSLVFNALPSENNASADVVIGQVAISGELFPNQGSDPNADTLYEPRRVCLDSGRLIIADRNNNRVLIYDSIPETHNAAASVVIGQPDFISTEINQGLSVPAAYTLSGPTGVAVSGGKLIVTDTDNHRILIFNQVPTVNNASADAVLGQLAFDLNLPNQGWSYPDSSTLSRPFGSVCIDGSRLFVTDNGNHRVLIYHGIPNDMSGAPYAADTVLGQPDMFSNLVNQVDPDPPPDPPSPAGPNTLYWPDGLFLQGQYLYIADTHNNRILIFKEATPTPTPEDYKTPTPTPSTTPSPSATPTPTATPSVTPTPSATPSVSPTPEDYKTPTPSVTPTPSPPPTATPTTTPSPSASLTPPPSATPTPSVTLTPSATPTASPTPTASATPSPPGARRARGDYDGDGTSDPAIFRESSGLWAVRGVTRVYFGGSVDLPVPRDYSGSGTTEIGIFRAASGLWAVRGLTRTYFGGSGDQPLPGYFAGGGARIAIFRPGTGLWAIRGVTRIYFGGSGDQPLAADFSGDGTESPAIFRESTGLWAFRGLTRFYFGGSADHPLTGDFAGDGTGSAAIFRQASGLWALRQATRVYFGGVSDSPVPADYSGEGRDGPAVFRPDTGLWAVRGLTRLYFGSSSDQPVVE